MSTGDRRRAAAAVRYDPSSDHAPQVVAAGSGEQARRLLELAAEHGLPVRSDPLLAEALAQLASGDHIPEQLFGAVAEALLWAWQADQQAGKLAQVRQG